MFNGGSTSLKFYRRLNVFKNSTGTVEFDPVSLTGRSYRWTFLAKVKDVLVFNSYNWSSTTSNHQSAVRSILEDKRLSYITGDFGRADVRYIGQDAVKELYKQVFKLEVEIESSTRTESWAHGRRVSDRAEILENISKLESLGRRFKVSKRELKALRIEAFENEMNRISQLECDKCFKFLSLKTMSEDLNSIDLTNI